MGREKRKRDSDMVTCFREAAGRESVIRRGLSIKGNFAPVYRLHSNIAAIGP